MKAKISLILKPLVIGIGAIIFTFMAMMMTLPIVTSIFAALLYFSLGIWVGRKQPQSLWYAPLLMNIFIWIIFISMGMELWPPKIYVWYFLLPPLVALPAAYLGMYIGSTLIIAKPPSTNDPQLILKGNLFSSHQLKVVGSYIILFLAGLSGMFVCLFLLFLFTVYLGFSFGASYALSYLLLYPSLALVQGLIQKRYQDIIIKRLSFG